MTKDFIKRNRVYIALLCFIILANVLPRIIEKSEPIYGTLTEETVKPKVDERGGTFVDFREAAERSKKLEGVLKGSRPLYFFYVFLNLAIVFLFLLGLAVDGYFLFKKSRREKIFEKHAPSNPPPWEIGDICKIAILTLTAGYIFFAAFSFFTGVLESLLEVKFQFYDNENFRMVFDTIILDAIVFLVILGFLRRGYKKSLPDLGFSGKNLRKNILYGVAGYLALIPVIVAIGIVVYVILNFLKITPPPQPIVGLFLAESNTGLIYVSSIIAVFFGPVIEEIFFRGVMYNAVKRKIGVFWGITITSVLFSFLHTHAVTYFLVGFLPIAILGAALAYLYEKTGSLIPSITLHVLNNVGSVIMVFTFKYFNSLTGS
ncbi:MAG: CPBP family intramembrane metalloprotease [Omnitrophica bacterium]|nr:CPBP family intramembrane metalloprotease [Candidatus Omnitrophota bacterium]